MDVNQTNDVETIYPEITIEDLGPLIPKMTYISEDDTVNNYVYSQKCFQIKHNLTKVNSNIGVVLKHWANASPIEIYLAFERANYDPDIIATRLKDAYFRSGVRFFLRRLLANQTRVRSSSSSTSSIQDTNEYDDDDDEFDGDFDQMNEDYLDLMNTHSAIPKQFIKKKKAAVNYNNNIVRPQEVSESVWSTWSDAHRHSYVQGMEGAPNTFLYRNCPPGTKQRNGPWTLDEKKLFLKRLKEIRGDEPTINGEWGIFSLGIPGRVGYQCSNYYRKLIQDGEITDSQYELIDGKLHHKSRHGKYSKKGKEQAGASKKKTSKKRSTVHDDEDDDDDNDCGEQNQSSGRSSPEPLSRYEQWASLNPLAGYRDGITAEDIKVPAISPDGYVLDYNTWSKILTTSQVNPFTQQTLRHRDIVVLTIDNIDEYRPKIINLELRD